MQSIVFKGSHHNEYPYVRCLERKREITLFSPAVLTQFIDE